MAVEEGRGKAGNPAAEADAAVIVNEKGGSRIAEEIDYEGAGLYRAEIVIVWLECKLPIAGGTTHITAKGRRFS
ncbi:hypothetical protein [Sphingomonas azotifigens]|uniref:hypothetical protein n=1 Tax=Sphingomonas azotifigens TaxID=330920 RepID=UPI001C3FD86A|nr:hypothetical protein [Sphingomonas azotifigens]